MISFLNDFQVPNQLITNKFHLNKYSNINIIIFISIENVLVNNEQRC